MGAMGAASPAGMMGGGSTPAQRFQSAGQGGQQMPAPMSGGGQGQLPPQMLAFLQSLQPQSGGGGGQQMTAPYNPQAGMGNSMTSMPQSGPTQTLGGPSSMMGYGQAMPNYTGPAGTAGRQMTAPTPGGRASK